jgi:hypothetical protein
MHTKRHRSRKNRTRKMTGGKKWGGKTGKKWTTAIEAAQKTLSKTGSIQAARKSLRRQALTNARKLFGSVGSV